jgi:DNA-binding SARP family transcriptional activator/nucleoid-associated protein YgaU
MEPATPPDGAGGKLRLLGFSALVLAGGAVLDLTAGPLRPPSALPSLSELRAVLTGSALPLDALAYVVVTLAWLLWLWIIASLGLQLIVLGLEVVARGSAVVVTLRQVANRLSIPIARRVVTTAFAVQVLTRAVPVAAAPIDPPPIGLVASTPEALGEPSLPMNHHSEHARATLGQYLVRPRDTLWSIAEKVYGSGHDWRRLVEANLGRRMPDGQRFTRLGVIQPGWVLDVPEPDSRVEESDGQRVYTVAAGDTLSGIAGRLFGNPDRWTELFSLNQGVARLEDGRTLTNPNLIWPGLRLRLPDEPAQAEPGSLQVAAAPAETPHANTAVSDAPVEVKEIKEIKEIKNAERAETASLPVDRRAPDRVEPDGPPLQPVALSTIGRRIELQPPPDIDQPTDTPEADQAASAELPLAAAAGVVGIAALAGAATLGVQRVRRLRPLHQEPESEVVVEGGYAEAVLTTTLTHRLHGGRAEPVVVLATHLRRFLSEHALPDVQVIAVRHGRSATTLVLAANLADQPKLLQLAPSFAERVGASAEAWLSEDHDVLIKLARPRQARLLPATDACTQDPLCLLPIGLLYDRQILYAEWRALGHVLVASLPGHGADTILTSLLATLTARRSPDELRLWTIARPRDLPAPLASLPHQRRTVDASDEQAVAEAVHQLRRELEARMAGQPAAELVVVLSELATLGDHASDLELVAHHGPEHGIRLLAATTDLEGVHHPLVPFFATRLVLQTADEERSVALIGSTDAAYLGGGGRLLLRLDAREPVEVYGYRVAPEHLDRLVTVMRTTYGLETSARPTPPTPAPARQPPPPRVEQPAPIRTVEAPPAAHTELAQPPLEIVCFGGPRVLHAGRRIWPAGAGGDAKPWEVLVLLATHPASGVAREAIVAALWPDDPEADANHRLRQLRYRLRACLDRCLPGFGADPIRIQPGGILSLDPALVRSDAQQFLELIEAARTTSGPAAIPVYEQARALYAGDLLGAPEARKFAWVDDRPASGVTLREAFRAHFHNLTMRLGQLYVEAERLEEAESLYEELTTADAGDESLWRALFRVLGERGDRQGLARAERRMRRALQELDAEARIVGQSGAASAEPSEDTLRELQRLVDALDAAQRSQSVA